MFHWKRIGLAAFAPYQGIDFVNVDNKDASIFPVAIPNHRGKMQLGLLHRPLFAGTRPEDTACQVRRPSGGPRSRESIWISYCPMPPKGLVSHRPGFVQFASPLGHFNGRALGASSRLVAAPRPILTRHGWLILYHGVSKPSDADRGRTPTLLLGGRDDSLRRSIPREILYRSPQPVLTPESPDELRGTIANVVFPTGIDRRDDLGQPDRFDVYYGMADSRIGVARLDLPGAPARHGAYGQRWHHHQEARFVSDQRRFLTNRGVVVAVRGSVVDVRFDHQLPPISSVLHAGREGEIVIEVLAQRDAQHVRGIALTPTQGLARGMVGGRHGRPAESAGR